MIGVIIALVVSFFIIWYLFTANQKLKEEKLEIISINTERQQLNETIERDIKFNTEKLNQIKDSITTQNSVVQSLTSTAETLSKEARYRAEQEYMALSEQLTDRAQGEYDLAAAEFNKKLSIIEEQVKQETEKLNNLQAKQLTYIQAQQRQQEIDEQQDYYRLVINEIDLNDIKLLRELQSRFSRKDAIDKIIWEVYYKPAYDILMSHLFQQATKVCGVYKITNLTNGQAYIGQSVDCRERFRQHIKTSLSYGPQTNKLYQQMQKYGQTNFTFEVLETVNRASLNERETFWIDFYKTKDYGMNKTIGGS